MSCRISVFSTTSVRRENMHSSREFFELDLERKEIASHDFNKKLFFVDLDLYEGGFKASTRTKTFNFPIAFFYF